MTEPSSPTAAANPDTGTIDLGMISDEGPADAAAGWPVRPRVRRLAEAVGWRLPAAAVAAVLVAFGATAAAPSTPWASLLLEVRAHYVVADEDTLYVVEPSEQNLTVAAHRLSNGQRHWSTPLHAPADGTVTLGLLHDTLLLIVQPIDEAPPQTTALDIADGSALWHANGLPHVLWQHGGGSHHADRDLLVVLRYAATTSPMSLVAVDRRTGDERWSVPGAGAFIADLPGQTYLVTHQVEVGRLASYDVAGREVADRPLPDLLQVGLQSAGGLALLNHDEPASGSREPSSSNQPAATLVAYDPETLDEQWSVETRMLSIFDCGRWICGFGLLEPPHARDPATGLLAWSADWLPTSENWAYMTGPDHPALSEYVIIHSPQGPNGSGTWLAAADTGEPVLDLGDWLIPPAQRGDWLFGVSHGVGDGTAPTVSRSADDGIWVATLDPELSTVHPRGRLAGTATADNCGAPAPHTLVCGPSVWGAEGSTVQVWHVNR